MRDITRVISDSCDQVLSCGGEILAHIAYLRHLKELACDGVGAAAVIA